MSDTRLGAGGKGKSMHHFTTVLQMLCVDHSVPRDLGYSVAQSQGLRKVSCAGKYLKRVKIEYINVSD